MGFSGVRGLDLELWAVDWEGRASGGCLGPLCCAFSSAPKLSGPLPRPVAVLDQLVECLLWKRALSVVAELSQCATPTQAGCGFYSGFWHSRGFKDQRRQQNNALVPSNAMGGVAISLQDGLSGTGPGRRSPTQGLCEARAGQTGAVEAAKRSRGRARPARTGSREKDCS